MEGDGGDGRSVDRIADRRYTQNTGIVCPRKRIQGSAPVEKCAKAVDRQSDRRTSRGERERMGMAEGRRSEQNGIVPYGEQEDVAALDNGAVCP